MGNVVVSILDVKVDGPMYQWPGMSSSRFRIHHHVFFFTSTRLNPNLQVQFFILPHPCCNFFCTCCDYKLHM